MEALSKNFVHKHSWNRALDVVWVREEDGIEEAYVRVRDLESYLWYTMRDVTNVKREFETECGETFKYFLTLTLLDGAHTIMNSLWNDIRMRWHFEINAHFHC